MFDFPNSPSVGQSYTGSNGLVWEWDGTAWISTPTAVGEITIRKTFIPGAQGSTTTYTYNKPSNLRQLEFEGVAAGGSAGCAAAAAASTWGFASGGGGGSWGRKLFAAAALPSSVIVTIGVPGSIVPTQGNGVDGQPTTFGSLITLPGGLKGFLGTNVAYTSWNSISGSGFTAYPTGVDVGSPGESSDFQTVGFAIGSSPGTVLGHQARAGGSPWGKAFPAQFIGAAGLASQAGSGYGWGSSGGIASGGQGAKASVAGGPGAVLLTEYLTIAPADTARPQRQTFYPSGTGGQNIPVPPTAKLAKITGALYQTSTTPAHVIMRWSVDGATFLSGATDYAVNGFNVYSGSTASPAKQAYTGSNAVTLAPGSTTHATTPIMFECDLIVGKPDASKLFGSRHRGWGYDSQASLLAYGYQWDCYGQAATFQTVAQMAAFQIIPTGGGGWAAGSVITVDWIY